MNFVLWILRKNGYKDEIIIFKLNKNSPIDRSTILVFTYHPNCKVVKCANIYVSLRLRVQNAVPAQPCVGKLGISLVLLNFLHCNFRLWFKTP